MKKAIALFIAVLVALSSTAVNRLYLPDFTISPGETVLVALILENDEPFTAFQTDLILPEGLTVVQEDDEYLFELSERKATDHTIISKLRDDGAIRMVSFSIGVRTFKGNNGALVIIPLTAAEDFAGPAAVGLKNSIVVNVEGEEFFLARDSCEAIYMEQHLMGDTNGDGYVTIDDVTWMISYLLVGCQTSFHVENADLNGDSNVNISDVTALINILLTSP